MQSSCFGSEQHLGRRASFSPRGARSESDQQPDGRVAHNQKLQNILGVDIGILATRVLRARKTRKSIRGIGEFAYVSREEYRSSITDYLCNWDLRCSGLAECRWRWILVECSQDLMGISTAELGDA
jgi:hypothetical protein